MNIRKVFILILALLLSTLVGVLDYSTVPEFEIFYLLPIVLSSWYVNRWAGVFFSLLCAGIWLYDDLHTLQAGDESFVPYWDALVRMGMFISISLVVSALKKALEAERQLSRTDATTQVANARFFYEQLDFEIHKNRRYGHPFSLIFMDVDNFKTVNDQFGHSAGDALLKLIASTIKKSVRRADFVARTGGDEFAMLLPETGRDGGCDAANKIQSALASAVEGRNYPVTFSLGLVTFLTPPESVDEAAKMADDCMYAAKRGGKNRIQCAVHEDPRPAARPVTE
jgi:diguanylate cyclase (GGDEF)-like protein